MTVSVASSPILFRIASAPLAYRAATYDVAGSAPLRASSVAAIRASTASSASRAIDRVRVLQDRLDRVPFALVEPLVEAALAAGVAGDAANLLDDQQDRVAVAI